MDGGGALGGGVGGQEGRGWAAAEDAAAAASATASSIRSVPAAEEGAPASPQAVDAIVAASLPWYAVYERLGVPSVAAELEADAARRRVADVAAQLEAWTDGGDAWRTETDVGRPDIPGLFEELVHDTF